MGQERGEKAGEFAFGDGAMSTQVMHSTDLSLRFPWTVHGIFEGARTFWRAPRPPIPPAPE